MAEICFDCLNQIEGLTHKKKMYIISRKPDLCEECGQLKPVVIRMKRRYVFTEGVKEWVHDMRILYGKKR